MRLAIDFAKSFATEGKRVAIMFPDRAESDRAIETHGADEPFTNIILRPLAGPAPGTTSSPVDIVMGLFGKQGGRNVNAVPDADMYICLVFSAQELPDLEALHMADPSKPLGTFGAHATPSTSPSRAASPPHPPHTALHQS